MKKSFRTISTLLSGLILAALSASAGAVATAPNPIITLNESGVGTLFFSPSGTFASPGVLAPDPGPGGLPSALTYNLLGPPSLVAGDLLISLNGNPSEVIRFNPAGTSAGYPASVVFYSVSGGGMLADTGFPTLNYANTLSAAGTSGADLIYSPTALQPGYVGGFNVEYHLAGNTAVPEPSSFGLAIGGLALLIYKVRRR